MTQTIQCRPGDRVRVNLSGAVVDADVLSVWTDGAIGVKTAEHPFEQVVYPGEVVEKLPAQPAPATAAGEGEQQ